MLRFFGSGGGDLAVGQEFRLRNAGTTGIVGRKLGEGGQGTVYLTDVGGRQLALKWYKPNVVQLDTTLRARIERLVQDGPPDKRFLFPVDLVTIEGRSEFGYVMPVVSEDRRQFKDVLRELSLEAIATACYEIADSFQQLHTRGLSYQDINFGAFFVDPIRGGVLICDVDNITVEGLQGGVLGTRPFMAPELQRGEAIPSSATDLHSMAVLFFQALFLVHPLGGTREAAIRDMTAEAQIRLYGREPAFMFDPASNANGPVPGAQEWVVARWRAMPPWLRELFVRSFTEGLARPEGRVVESEWRRAMARLRDAVTPCSVCALEIPLDASANTTTPACPSCGGQVLRPVRMTLGHYLVAMRPDGRLFAHHVEPGAPVALREQVGTVDRHPKDETKIGLRNLSSWTWTSRTREGRPLTVVPGSTVRILDGLDIDFGRDAGRREGLVVGADPLDRSAA